MRTTDFDRLATSAPLNTDAAMARDAASRDHWEAKIPEHHARWPAPPAPLAVFNRENGTDLTGRVMGRVTVVRYHAPGSRGGRWLVRCTCGYYELRSAAAIKANKAGDGDHCCYECERVKVLRKRASGKFNNSTTREASAVRLDEIAAKQRGAA